MRKGLSNYVYISLSCGDEDITARGFAIRGIFMICSNRSIWVGALRDILNAL